MAAAAKRATQRVGQMLVALPEQRLTWTVTTSGARVQQVTCTPIPRRLREVQGRSSLLAALCACRRPIARPSQLLGCGRAMHAASPAKEERGAHDLRGGLV
uniref:Uncharacterized protein n=1 Tax=Prasinoderma singulare TaxID=676789 RepID=A0A7S3BVB5_9VIRI